MKAIKRIVLLWALTAVTLMPVCAAAVRTGSVTVRMVCREEVVSGGSITLYRLAALSGDGRYVPEPDFEGCGVALDRDLTPEIAQRLAQYAAQNCPGGRTQSLGRDGTAVFSGLTTGLYLLVQQEAGEGYLPVMPFFVGVPQIVGGEPVYDVDAEPKCAPESAPGMPGIPQTGQHKWPVPLMAALGLAIFAAGGFLWLLPGKDTDET